MGYQSLLRIRVREDINGYGEPIKTTVKPLMRQVSVYSYPQFNRKPVGLLIAPQEEMLVYPDSFRDGFIRVYVGTDFGWIHVEQVEIEGLSFEVQQENQDVLWRMRNSFAAQAAEEPQERKAVRKSKQQNRENGNGEAGDNQLVPSEEAEQG